MQGWAKENHIPRMLFRGFAGRIPFHPFTWGLVSVRESLQHSISIGTPPKTLLHFSKRSSHKNQWRNVLEIIALIFRGDFMLCGKTVGYRIVPFLYFKLWGSHIFLYSIKSLAFPLPIDSSDCQPLPSLASSLWIQPQLALRQKGF